MRRVESSRSLYWTSDLGGCPYYQVGILVDVGELSTNKLPIAVLANMREFYEETLNNSPPEAAALKREYSEMLQTMMKSMKEIYQVTHLSHLYVSGRQC